MIKSILILHYKEIPGNLNFKVPNPGIKGIQEGKLKVVDKRTPFEGKYWLNVPDKTMSYSSHEFNLTLTICLTADPGVASWIPSGSHTFMEIDHEIISTAILLPSADSRRVVISYKQKYVHEVLVKG